LSSAPCLTPPFASLSLVVSPPSLLSSSTVDYECKFFSFYLSSLRGCLLVFFIPRIPFHPDSPCPASTIFCGSRQNVSFLPSGYSTIRRRIPRWRNRRKLILPSCPPCHQFVFPANVTASLRLTNLKIVPSSCQFPGTNPDPAIFFFPFFREPTFCASGEDSIPDSFE